MFSNEMEKVTKTWPLIFHRIWRSIYQIRFIKFFTALRWIWLHSTIRLRLISLLLFEMFCQREDAMGVNPEKEIALQREQLLRKEKKTEKKLWGLKIIAATTPYIGHNEWCFKVSKNLKNYYKNFLLHFSFIFSLSWKMRDRIIFLSIVTSSSFHSNVNIWAQLKRCVVKVYEWRLKLWWYKNIIIYVFFAHVIEISCLNNKNVNKNANVKIYNST